MKSKSGFRKTTRKLANEYGNIVFSQADKEAGARLAAADVDEEWADEHVRRSLAEIQATWTPRETELRAWHEPEVETREVARIDFRSCGLRIG
jgi:hypothetical protein